MEKKECCIKINEYIRCTEEQIIQDNVDCKGMTYTNLRDRLIGLGTILEENFENTYYVVSIGAGIANKNTAVVMIIWTEHVISIYAYAKEGLIKQKTAKKAIEKVKNKMKN